MTLRANNSGVCARARRIGLVLLATVLLQTGCAPSSEPPASIPPSEDRARDLAVRLLIADTHIDVPYRLTEKMADVGLRTADGDFDYPRAREGGLDLAFMSVYVPASYQETGGAREYADGLIDMVQGIAASHPDKFRVVADVTAAREAFHEGLIGLALGMENGAPVEDDLANLAHFHTRGIRYITLTHSKDNQICDSSYDERRTWGGLSPFGREVVAEMNRLGIMIDVSHVTDDTLFQVLEQSRAPVIASHSSCRAFTPGWERNIDDEGIRRLAARGGVVQINFGSSFLSDAYRLADEAQERAVREHAAATGVDPDSPEAREYRRLRLEAEPLPRANVGTVADHIDHVVRLVGIDHVGLGSDFDGVGDSLPVGLEDVAGYPNLLRELLDRGYSDESIEKICSGNLLRVWGDVERVARESQASS